MSNQRIIAIHAELAQLEADIELAILTEEADVDSMRERKTELNQELARLQS